MIVSWFSAKPVGRHSPFQFILDDIDHLFGKLLDALAAQVDGHAGFQIGTDSGGLLLVFE